VLDIRKGRKEGEKGRGERKGRKKGEKGRGLQSRLLAVPIVLSFSSIRIHTSSISLSCSSSSVFVETRPGIWMSADVVVSVILSAMIGVAVLMFYKLDSC
jgi:hypothetical protein